jgi:hypothetical protein
MPVVTDPLFAYGQSEGYKAGIHLALFGLATTALLYNAGAFLARRETHLAVTAGLYSALVVFEARLIMRHLS